MSSSDSGTYQLPVSIRSLGDIDRSGHWLGQGWRDFIRAPGVSLMYGGVFVVVGLALTIGLIWGGLGSLILPLAGGLMILAPILIVGLYDVARRLEAGLPVSIANCFSAFGRSAGQLAAMGIVLLVCYLFWVRSALLLFALFFNQDPPPFDQFLQDVVLSLQGRAAAAFRQHHRSRVRRDRLQHLGNLHSADLRPAGRRSDVDRRQPVDRARELQGDVRVGGPHRADHVDGHRHGICRPCRRAACAGLCDVARLSRSHCGWAGVS
ncbi:MAG: DUF2189 domain-containing protein [Rhodospirillales bacterium]|nr:DUF2189 domain-containing protein [Rhodospirillales bacterium]